MERRTDKKETPQKSLTKNETVALKDLSWRCNIIIFKVDKIVDRKKVTGSHDYISEANQQPNNKVSHKEISNGLTITNKTRSTKN